MHFAIWIAPSRTAFAEEPAPAVTEDLSVEQARLADRFKRLEEVFGRLAELSASNDPRRARLLREAIAQSREQDINVRFEAVVKLLEDERLAAASTNQTGLQKDLDALLALLLKADRDRELASERERVQKYLKEVARLIRLQQGIRARTDGGDDLDRLGDDQQRVAGDTGKLSGDIEQNESEKKAASEGEGEGEEGKPGDCDAESQPSENGKPGDESKPGEESKPGAPSKPGEGEPADGESGEPNDAQPSDGEPSPGQPGAPMPGGESGEQGEQGQPNGQPSEPQDPADRATQRLRAAQQQMEQARKKLEEAERKGATERQREAIKELEQAKAELERILRQLREEELERTLTQLAARFRKMLEMQTAVYDGTVRLDSVPDELRDHDTEIEAARLSRQEAEIVREADKAMLVLREEGSSVAFPEAVEQMREDMQQVVEWLAAVKVGENTQALERDIIAALEEMIAALEKAIKDLERNRTPPGQQPAAGQPGDRRLLDQLAELKMIRALQVRVYTRTQWYGKMIEGEQAQAPELLEALRKLAERQQRVHQATADLVQGRND